MNYVYLNVRWTRWFAGWLMMVMVIKGTFVLIHIMQIMERINYYCFLFSALNFRPAAVEKGEQKGQVKVPSLCLREDKDFYPNYYYYVEL